MVINIFSLLLLLLRPVVVVCLPLTECCLVLFNWSNLLIHLKCEERKQVDGWLVDISVIVLGVDGERGN